MPLRPFNQHDIRALVDQFKIKIDEKQHGLNIIGAENLSPDSTGVVMMSDGFYVLYSEDYIESLDAVGKAVEEWFPSEAVEFIKPKHKIDFEKTGGSQFYRRPDFKKIDEWMQFAVPDGWNFAFLMRVQPSARNSCWWVTTALPPQHGKLPPEIRGKRGLPMDPAKSFLENWQTRHRRKG